MMPNLDQPCNGQKDLTLSWMTLAKGARQLVVQEALEMTWYSDLYWSRLTPHTNLASTGEDHECLHGGVGGRRRDDHLFGATLQVEAGLFNGGEDTGGLDNVVCAGLSPFDVGRVSLAVDNNGLVVDEELAFLLFNGAFESTVHGVVFEHVDLGT